MLQIKITDARESFRNVPKPQTYSIYFYYGFSVYFSNKREAFKFISKFSSFASETLTILEMLNTSIHAYSFQLKCASYSNKDAFNIYHSNYHDILKNITAIKSFNDWAVDMSKLFGAFVDIIQKITENCKILNRKNYNCVAPYQIIIDKTRRKFNEVVKNSLENFKADNLVLIGN